MDNAFKSRPFAGHTLANLEAFVANGAGTPAIVAEIARRKAVLAGDTSVMFPSERLVHNRKNPE